MTRIEFEQLYPGIFYLEIDQPHQLADYLRRAGVMRADESVRVLSKAGEGNMNCTARVTTDRQSLIVKQARPWVERYPQFAAPWDRALREIEFYQIARSHASLAPAMPRLIWTDPNARLLVLEDFGAGLDYSGLYAGATLDLDVLDQLTDYLSALHQCAVPADAWPGLANREMRRLNADHIFRIPLEPHNGLHLDAIQTGLGALGEALRSDPVYCRGVRHVGASVYLVDGPCLVHGDFFPGSWVRSATGPRIIDPEFAYLGRPEFDSGVFLAHLVLSQQPASSCFRFLDRYRPPPGHEEKTALQLAGIEIMRRLIGYAQLPLRCDLGLKRRWLSLSRQLVLNPDRGHFRPQ